MEHPNRVQATLRQFMKAMLVVALIATSSAVGRAGTIAFSFSSASPLSTVCCGTYGFQFTPTVDILVDSLGYLDVGQDGLAAGHQVGIWNAGGTLLTSATVTTADSTLAGAVLAGAQFRFTPITALLLLAGQTYTLGAEEDASDLMYYDFNGSQTSNAPSLLSVSSGGYFTVNSGFVDPTNTIGNHYDIGNFTAAAAAAIPEPSSTALMILGLAGVLAVRFRRLA
jgi:hypothetical protein